MATGWLGWPPDVAWEAPISQISIALEGKIDFTIKTNPFGGGKDKPKGETDEEKKKREMLEKNKALAMKFDMMMLSKKREKVNG